VSQSPTSDTSGAPRAIFRIAPTAMFAIVLLAVCATPVAFAAPGLQLIYLVPLALAVWVARVRTTVDPDGLAVRTLTSGRRVSWDEVRGLRITPRSRVHVVLHSDEEVPMPAVHPRDLPLISAASRGRLPDPTAPSATVEESSSADPERDDVGDVPADPTGNPRPTDGDD